MIQKFLITGVRLVGRYDKFRPGFATELLVFHFHANLFAETLMFELFVGNVSLWSDFMGNIGIILDEVVIKLIFQDVFKEVWI